MLIETRKRTEITKYINLVADLCLIQKTDSILVNSQHVAAQLQKQKNIIDNQMDVIIALTHAIHNS